MQNSKKYILLILFYIVIGIFLIPNVYAAGSCPSGSELIGDVCISAVEATCRSGSCWCGTSTALPKGRDICISTFSPNNMEPIDNSNLYCKEGYDLYNSTCIKYVGKKACRSGSCWCNSGTLIGEGCFVYESASDSITYTTTWDEGYSYHDVKDCSLEDGVIGVRVVDNHKVCLTTSKKNIDIIQGCAYSSSGPSSNALVGAAEEKFELNEVKGSDGKIYYGYGCRRKKSVNSGESITTNIDYNSLCSDNNIKASMKIIGYVILVVKWLAPLIIIVLGMVDYGKAVVSDDEQAINKATKSLIRRIISGVVIFFIPTIVYATLNLIKVTKGIETEEDSNFGACTLCLVKPLTDCKVEKR